MIRTVTRKGRFGFTVVELLVVIAIIAVLAGLITAGVMVGFTRMNDSRNAMEITQLSAAIANFQTQFKAGPPISKIKLLNNLANYTNNPLDVESKSYLLKVWPRLQASVDWSGAGNPNSDNGTGWSLEGDQCLVFFLGGIPGPAGSPGVTGFAASPTDPTALGGTRTAPLFAFQTARLVLLPCHPNNPFYSYNDVYGTTAKASPFAYFAPLKQVANQYNPYLNYPYGQNATVLATGLSLSDCNGIGAMPYQAPSAPPQYVPQFQNPTTYQIISGGVDQTFGSNTSLAILPPPYSNSNPPYTPGPVIFVSSGQGATFNAYSSTAPLGAAVTGPFPAADDRTNFCPNILSAGGAQ